MNKLSIFTAAVAIIASAVVANAQEPAKEVSATDKVAAKEAKKSEFKAHLQNHYKFYGFVRNYFAYDNRESVSGTGDLYYWLPKDRLLNDAGEDMNAVNQFRFLSITSRVGVDVSGYKINNIEFGGKIEADFYAGLSGSTGTAQFRLRQAFATVNFTRLGKNNEASIGLKIGQAWHPMAADLPDIFSLESGAPFNAFSRTPQVTADFNFNANWSITASFLWQMQYCSMGPVWTKQDNGTYTWKGASSADFMKYGCTPEFYLGLNYKKGGFLARVGADLLSIAPRHYYYANTTSANPAGKASDRITTVSPYIYLQYTKDKLKLKGKTIYSSAGEHMNLMSGYAVTDITDATKWEYTPLHCSSTWVTVSYGKKVNGAILLGYLENFGTSKEIVGVGDYGKSSYIYFQKSGYANIKRMFRVQPEVTYNIGKFTVGLEYMLTGVQYGDGKSYNRYALSLENLHWILNHRVQAMVKFTF